MLRWNYRLGLLITCLISLGNQIELWKGSCDVMGTHHYNKPLKQFFEIKSLIPCLSSVEMIDKKKVLLLLWPIIQRSRCWWRHWRRVAIVLGCCLVESFREVRGRDSCIYLCLAQHGCSKFRRIVWRLQVLLLLSSTHSLYLGDVLKNWLTLLSFEINVLTFVFDPTGIFRAIGRCFCWSCTHRSDWY